MELVVDANVLVASFIRRGETRKLLLADDLVLAAPEFVFSELGEHRGEILKRTGRTSREFDLFLDIVKSRVRVVPAGDVRGFWKQAESLSPDPDDVAYFALALKTGCGIWSNDRRLKNQKRVEIWTTRELLQGRGRGSSG